MVTTLLVMPFINICHLPSPSLRLAACPLERHVLQQVDLSHVHIKAFRTVTCFTDPISLGDIRGSVPEYQNIVNITIKSVTQNFWLPRVYKSYVETTL